ncbi:MAG TPA: hypothetical protein DD626_02075 [Clostridiales bacterium]|nr:hypothetical protein [Clostridiales bacterium]
MLEDLLGERIAKMVGDEKSIAELRVRVDRPLLACGVDGKRKVVSSYGAPYVVTQKDVEDVLARATNMSFYSASDEMKRGYVPCKHYRIGVGGEGVLEGGKLMGIKNVAFLVIRVPHQIKGIADKIAADVFKDGKLRNTLIVSPTGGGKTTLLRELARIASKRFNVVVIDERYELCAMSKGVPLLDIGDVEVVSGVPKKDAYENCVRAMNPDIIVTDELFGIEDVKSILDVMRCGVSVFATLHGESVESVQRSEFAPLIEAFDVVYVLGKNPVGAIVEKKI